jgi:profilin
MPLRPNVHPVLTPQYDSPIQAGDTNVVVTKLADYLKGVGY